MLRILKDCILGGMSVHEGEILPITDLTQNDINVIIGAGCAEFYVGEVDGEVIEDEDAVPEEPEDFTVAPVAKSKKRKTTKKTK